jgi:hypothetical protein
MWKIGWKLFIRKEPAHQGYFCVRGGDIFWRIWRRYGEGRLSVELGGRETFRSRISREWPRWMSRVRYVVGGGGEKDVEGG